MEKEPIAALIAVAGVLVSALVALIASLKVARNESAKLRVEAKKTYDGKILDIRHNSHPALYAILSEFIKSVQQFPQYPPVTKDFLEKFLHDVNQWDSKHAIYLSPGAAFHISRLRNFLRELLAREDLPEWLSAKENLEMLRTKANHVELSLRSDLGIFGVRAEKDIEIEFLSSRDEVRKKFPAKDHE